MRKTSPKAEPKPSSTVASIRAAFTGIDILPAVPGEMVEAHDFAERLIGGKIASADSLGRVHARTGAGLFVYRENGELTGLVALILLSERGLKAVCTDKFDAIEPAVSHVARRDHEPFGVYAWGIAASNHPAAKRMMEALGVMVGEAIPHLAFFGRVATEAGRRLVVERIGFKPVPGSTTDLLWIEPLNQRLPAVAA
jgi:hypothetical protein